MVVLPQARTPSRTTTVPPGQGPARAVSRPGKRRPARWRRCRSGTRNGTRKTSNARSRQHRKGSIAGQGAWAAHTDELPAAAEARMAEIRASGTWGSALTSDEFAAIRSVGFEPVGQVLGACVYNIGYTGGYSCPGAWADLRATARSCRPRTHDAGLRARRLGLVRARWSRPCTRRGVRPSDRMTAECEELGGHGVVGVRLTIGAFPAGGLEFKAIGTAIRAPASGRSTWRHAAHAEAAVHLRSVRPGLRQADP